MLKTIDFNEHNILVTSFEEGENFKEESGVP